jgi:hypothetical protein
MTSWRVEFRNNGSGKSTIVDLIDSAGPLNEWRAHDRNAFVPNGGDFTNQTERVVPTVQPSWTLSQIDIDKTSVGASGPGEVLDGGGTFPNGEVTWTILGTL